MGNHSNDDRWRQEWERQEQDKAALLAEIARLKKELARVKAERDRYFEQCKRNRLRENK